MANRFWIGDAGAGGDLWSNPNAWSALSGGVPVGAIPVAADNVFFNAASVRNCTLDMDAIGANTILTMDCNGYVRTFNHGAFRIRLTGLLFRLSAGMTYNIVGAAAGVQPASVAGNTLITTNGKQLGNLNVGVLGAGGTYTIQDPLNLNGYLEVTNGVFDTNNRGVTMNGSLNIRPGALAGAFVAHADIISIGQNINVDPLIDWLTEGTSSFVMTGGSINLPAGGVDLTFYDLSVAVFGNTNLNLNVGQLIIVTHIFIAGAGTVALGGAGGGVQVTSALVNGFQPDPACTLNVPIILIPRTGAGTTVLIPPCNIGGDLTLTRDGGTYGAVAFQLTGAVTVTGTLAAYGGGGAAFAPTLNLNAFNLAVTGPINFGNGANGMGLVTIGAATLSCTGALTHLGNPLVDSRIFDIAGGQLLVGGNFTHTGAVNAIGQRINMTLNSLVRVGGSWNTTAALVFNPVPVGDTSAVQFTAAGAFAIACNVSEVWPVVRISGGGTVALPTRSSAPTSSSPRAPSRPGRCSGFCGTSATRATSPVAPTCTWAPR